MNSFKAELWKATHNRYFLLALLCGFLIQAIQVCYNIPYMAIYLESALPHIGLSGRSLFAWWISMDGYTVGHVWLHYLFPLLAALPFGWSLAGERRSGYQNSMLIRQSRTCYFLAKYLACFLVGGGLIAAVLLTNLLLNAMILPAVPPNCYDMIGLFSKQFMSGLYYTHPWLHAFLWIGVDFLWGGSLSCLCMLAGQIVKRPVFVVLIPFVVLLALDYLCAFGLGGLEYSPFRLLMLQSLVNNTAPKVLWEIGVVFLISFLPGLALYTSREVIA